MHAGWCGAKQAAGAVSHGLLVSHTVRRLARCRRACQADRLVGVASYAWLGGCLVSLQVGSEQLAEVTSLRGASCSLVVLERASPQRPRIQTRSWDGAWPAGLAWSASPPPQHLGEKLQRLLGSR